MGLEEELLKASKAGRSERVLSLIEQGADIDVNEGGEKIPGYILSNVDEPEQLQKMGYSLNRTPLMWALTHGDWELALRLLELGADPNLASNLGEQPMGLAAAGNAVEVMKAMKAAKAKPDKAGRHRQTPLMDACEAGAVDAVRWLLDNKAKLKRKNSSKESPLMIACRECRPEVVRVLLEAGADVNEDGDMGTALCAAVAAVKRVPMKDGQPQFISVHYTDHGVFTYAPVPEGEMMAIVEMLLKAGADPNLGLRRPLSEAAFVGSVKAVEALLAAGADPNYRDGLGQTALERAQMMNRDQVAEVLKPHTTAAPKPDEPALEFQAEYAPIPDLGEELKQSRFKALIAELEKRCGAAAESLENHLEIPVAESGLSTCELQEEASKAGAFLCDCTGSLEEPKRVAVFPSERWQDALAVLQTNGINYDLASQNIIDWMEECEKQHPFRILTIAHDLVGGEFLGEIANPTELAGKIYDFCPDSVEQGFGEVEELAEDLKTSGKFFYWWD